MEIKEKETILMNKVEARDTDPADIGRTELLEENSVGRVAI